MAKDNYDDLTKFLHDSEKEIIEIQNMTGYLKDSRKLLGEFLYGDGINRLKRFPDTDRNMFVQVFFTRPQLRLTRDNLYMSDKLAKLLNKRENSIERYVRILLDRRLTFNPNGRYRRGQGQGDFKKMDEVLKSPLVNNGNPFISVFNNALLSLTGWPDILMETYTSKEGIRQEQFVLPDGLNEYNRAFDLNARFLNVQEEPITLIIDTWLEYMSLLKRNRVVPYMDFLLSEIDFQTGIFVLVLASDNRSIKHIAKTIAIPTSNPLGKVFNFERESNKAKEMQELDILFKCFGAKYDSSWLLYDFNKTVASWNPALYSYLDGGKLDGSGYIELPPSLYDAFNNEAIPFIDLRYNKLEWLIEEKKIKKLQKRIKNGK